jgi:hypothetical protein
MRVPVRLLPLALRAVRAVKRALERLHDDLASLVEPQTVDDLVSSERRPLDIIVDPNLGAFDVYYVDLTRPRVCVDCGTSDDAGLCDSCAVLGTGRLPS